MEIIFSAIMGYFFGSLSPAALLSKIKNKNLRKQGTGNLGATNTMVVLGRNYGIFVMLFDIFKAFAAVKIAAVVFPGIAVSGIVSGSWAVVGHVFPFYLKFKGGKGLAAFGGLVLGVDYLLFLILLVIALVLMFVINYGFAMPISAAILFPGLYWLRGGSVVEVTVLSAVCLLIIGTHFGNILKARRGEDLKVREYVKKYFLN